MGLAVSPGDPPRTRKAVRPRDGLSASEVRATTMIRSAVFDMVDQILVPFSTNPPSTRAARVRMARSTSVPPPGSVRAKANLVSPFAIEGSSAFFCSSVPKVLTALAPDHTVTPQAQASPARERDSSSQTITWSIRSPPWPPYSSGMPMPLSPASAIRRVSS